MGWPRHEAAEAVVVPRGDAPDGGVVVKEVGSLIEESQKVRGRDQILEVISTIL